MAGEMEAESSANGFAVNIVTVPDGVPENTITEAAREPQRIVFIYLLLLSFQSFYPINCA
jgi:hypothetical protein